MRRSRERYMLEANSLSSSRSCVLVKAVRIRLLLGSWLEVLSGEESGRSDSVALNLLHPELPSGPSWRP